MAEVEVSRTGAVLTITLNRPDVLNALNRAAHARLRAALRAAESPEIRAVVITGAGRGFCVGQDLQEFTTGAGDVAARLRSSYHPNVLAIRALEKPVIAAVNGPAAGAGLSLALACDVRIAADSASFVPAFGAIGLVPDSGGTWLVRRVLGATRAFEWLTTGRRLSAEEAREWGLVNEVVPAADLVTRTEEVAELFAAMATRSVWRTKSLLDAAETATLPEQLEREALAQGELVETPDFQEGVAAFLAKRPAEFAGADVARPHPMTIVNGDDHGRWRLTTGLRALLVLPHSFVLALWGVVAVPVAVAAWLIALGRGRLPDALHDWLARYVRYATHVYAYEYLLADPFPRFRGRFGDYPVDLRVAPAAPQSRWKVALRLPLAVPALVFTYVLGIVLEVVAVISWFVGLAVGRVPAGVQDLGAYCVGFQMQTIGYLLLLTDRYPTLARVGAAVRPPAAR